MSILDEECDWIEAYNAANHAERMKMIRDYVEGEPDSTIQTMSQIHQSTFECGWIAPCPVCGAGCRVLVESGPAGLKVDVDYHCRRQHGGTSQTKA